MYDLALEDDAISLESFDLTSQDEPGSSRARLNATHDLGTQNKAKTKHSQTDAGPSVRISSVPDSSNLSSRWRRRRIRDEEDERRLEHGNPTPLVRQLSRAVHSLSARVVNMADAEPTQSKTCSPDSLALPDQSQGYFDGQTDTEELRGRTLGLFGPNSRLRQRLCKILINPSVEPLLLCLIILQAVVLTVESSYDIFDHPHRGTFATWADWTLLGIFILYTLEIVVRSIVSGFVVNPASIDTTKRPRMYHHRSGSVFGKFSMSGISLPAVGVRRNQLLVRAYLRRSYNRIDFIAVLAYWIYIILSLSKIEFRNHIFVFKAISCMRILRLLNVTRGTTTILQSLKKAAPLLVNVALFVGFFWLFIGVIGVQSFKGSFRRQCIWVDPLGIQPNVTQDLQFCGGQLINGTISSFLLDKWQPSLMEPKGYICPEQSFCVQANNPYGGTVHFDNIFNSLELVFVIMSSNTFSDIMYYTMDSDYFVSALFFIAGILILTFWLMSLVIAVVTTSFQVIRAEQHSSAFAAKQSPPSTSPLIVAPRSKYIKQWDKTNLFWVFIVVCDLATQAAKRSDMSSARLHNFDVAETFFTLVFAIEITIRAVCYLPRWRGFANKSNLTDLALALITCIIQIPVIKNSGSLYRWLTIFQIMRSYRVIQAIPLTRELLAKILGNTSGLVNLMFFLVCVVYIAALVACQLVRGDAPTEVYGEEQEITFKHVYNSFVGMYQILSSENWTQILYAVQSSETKYNQAWISAIFFMVWFVFGQNILMSMFIAVLQENFEVSEDDKRREQVRAYVQQSIPGTDPSQSSNLTMLSLIRRKSEPQTAPHPVSNFGSLSHDHSVHDFLDRTNPALGLVRGRTMQEHLQKPFQKLWSSAKSLVNLEKESDVNPFTSQLNLHQDVGHAAVDTHEAIKDVAAAQEARTAQQRAYLQKYPGYDKVLWCLGPDSRIRRLCQRVVASSSGERLHTEIRPRSAVWYSFSALMYLCTMAIVILACFVTPTYQKMYLEQHQNSRFAWYSWCDLALTLIFSCEFAIKVCADGFWLTPNAYFHNAWNRIDLFVLCTLWINVIADVLDRGSLSRAFRAFKALRALRLVNISDATKATFYDIMIAGFWNIAGATIVSIALLIPTAIWGLNLFSGRLYSCNDSNVASNTTCLNEYSSSPSNWEVWAPRAWENPQVWSFDSFGSSLLILFEIVSEEGWIDVMTSTMSINGIGIQPVQDASAVNAMFFILFNLLGAVFVLTLFIAVIIQNYSERSGVAYLTLEQRSWQEMRLLLKQVRPSRRPVDAPISWLRRKCFFAVKKHSLWSRVLIGAYTLHVLMLMTEHYPDQEIYNATRSKYSFGKTNIDAFFLALNSLYLANLVVRVLGLGWPLFVRSRWNLYNLVIIPITTVLNVIVFRVRGEAYVGVLTAEKIFLVLVAMNLIPAIDALDQLFKTTIGALSDLASLLATWLVLFITFAVAFNQIFGLTKINSNGSDNINFRSIPKALVVLFRMSCGEGWNAIMHDFTIAEPYCTASSNFYDSDCGSTSWAYFLFITWNILSMYIFVNIVISLVYNNFSYVYQRSGSMSVISRDEIRRFKSTWAQFDDGTGHVQKDQVARFLSKLEGAFEVRIYPAQFSVRSILAQSQRSDPSTSSSPGIDTKAVAQILRNMDANEIRKRRRSYNRLYTELMQRESHKGISFTAMLLIISHNKFVDENKSLSLAEFFRRRTVKLNVHRALFREYIYGIHIAREAQQELAHRLHRSTQTNPFRRGSASRSLRPDAAVSRSQSASSNVRRSWKLEARSLSPSGSQRQSQELDYTDILAGSAWSSAIGESSQTQSSITAQRRTSYSTRRDDK